MTSEWMTGTNDWLASANGIRMDDRYGWLISFGWWHPKGMTRMNKLLASTNGIRMDDQDKWLINSG
jgi:hypothetical protein